MPLAIVGHGILFRRIFGERDCWTNACYIIMTTWSYNNCVWQVATNALGLWLLTQVDFQEPSTGQHYGVLVIQSPTSPTDPSRQFDAKSVQSGTGQTTVNDITRANEAEVTFQGQHYKMHIPKVSAFKSEMVSWQIIRLYIDEIKINTPAYMSGSDLL